MKQPKISVVIPLYNKEKHILDTIASILQQRYPVDEIIVVDDGSTDSGAAIVEQTKLNNLILIKQANAGVSVARNTGIKAAHNEYVAFLDADDQWLPFFTEEMVQLIMQYPEVGVYTSRYQCIEPGEKYVDAKIAIDEFDPTGMLLDNYFEIASKGDLPFMISSCVIHQSVFDKVGMFPPGEPIGEDQDLFCRIALNGPIAYCPNINLMYHREADNRACLRNVPEQECPFSQRLEEQLETMAKSTSLTQDIRRYSAAHLCHLAKLNLYIGRWANAKKLLADARCQLKPKHRFGLSLIALQKQIQSYLTNTKKRIAKFAFN